jgi:hypothetical protein
MAGEQGIHPVGSVCWQTVPFPVRPRLSTYSEISANQPAIHPTCVKYVLSLPLSWNIIYILGTIFRSNSPRESREYVRHPIRVDGPMVESILYALVISVILNRVWVWVPPSRIAFSKGNFILTASTSPANCISQSQSQYSYEHTSVTTRIGLLPLVTQRQKGKEDSNQFSSNIGFISDFSNATWIILSYQTAAVACSRSRLY